MSEPEAVSPGIFDRMRDSIGLRIAAGGLSIAGLIGVEGSSTYALAASQTVTDSTQPMTPEQVMHAIRTDEANEVASPIIAIHLKRATLGEKTLGLYGSCDGPNWYGFKSIVDQGSRERQYICPDGDNNYNYKHAPVVWTKQLDKLGDRAAISDHISAKEIGDARHISATKNKAVINYARPSGNTGKSLKKLVLYPHKSPTKKYYTAEA